MSSITPRPPILVVEQDVALRTSITYTLRKEEHIILAPGAFSIDLAHRCVSRNGQILDLNRPLLFDLLSYLVRHRGIALTRTQLLAQVWGYEGAEMLAGDTHTVSIHIH